ncbi:MAG: proline--tRNA ligase [Phycisphaerales bacterium]|nr:proline--tRNA ligase [Phycisphaerales bacterium]
MNQTSTTAEHARTAMTTRRGDIQYWSRTIIPTTREAPSDAEVPSHVLLSRAGFIRKLAAGMYDLMPMSWRVLEKIMRIVREELNAIGSSELLLPALHPMEIYEATGRAEAYGNDLFRLTDRHNRECALGPTHEEVITEMMKGSVTSYKQLPVTLYQIQTKFRDEPRPRAGLLRGREFIMKDAYSFHLTVEGKGGLNETYDDMYQAYSNIFRRCGLDFTPVEAEAGPIGGSASHEFMVNADTGEDKVLRCPETGYAANVEKCEIGERAWSFDRGTSAGLEKVHTPNMPGIEGVAEHLGATAKTMLKTIVFETKDGDGYVLAVVRGDHEVNEGKVRDVVGHPIAMADEKKAKAEGFAIGYVSPRAINGKNATLVIDPDAAQGLIDWATGSDEMDHHVKHFNWQREMGDVLNDSSRVKVADIRNAEAGDPSPRAKGVALVEQRGIEVGHIFKLGAKYSSAMDFSVLDREQKRQTVIMGCYGIGVTRTMAACVEMSHDDAGIIWPVAVAPYHVLIVLMKPDNDEHVRIATELASSLADAGVDVLIDDRIERPGVKFKDADLIGIPARITIGDKALEAGGVEFKLRSDEGKGDVVPHADVVSHVLAMFEN